MATNWRNTKFDKKQKLAGVLMGVWLVAVIILAALSESNTIELPKWVPLIILASVVPILGYACRVLPIEIFTLRDSINKDDQDLEDSSTVDKTDNDND